MNSLNLKASVSFVGDGSTNKFYFGFDYINKQFVKVQIGNEGQSLTYPSDYTVDGRSVVLKNTPAVGVAIRVYRETSSDRIVEWADGAFIKASQMTLENLQQLHLIEEAQDYPILNSLSKYPDGVNFNALGSRVINVSDPKDHQDAVTKHYMESVQNGFVAANTILVQEATKQASAAKTSQEAAKTSETNAHTSETNSELSHQKAKKWAEATDSPDGEADTDSTTGKTQSSKSWSLYSKTKAQESATSATNAKSSETNAKTSETNAKSSETKAKTSETNAKNSEGNAATSEAHAKTSETNAKSSETKAATSESNAKTSETNAKSSETKAATSEINAKTSETNAKSSETNAKSSETNAKTSETRAKTSETNAKTSETKAKTSETNAKSSERNASASASASASSASASATSATNAHNSETAAANSAKQAAESAGVFQDFQGATASADGMGGKVPKPLAGQQGRYLKADGTWSDVPKLTPNTLWDTIHSYGDNYVPSDTSNEGWNKLGFASISYSEVKINNQPLQYGQLINFPHGKGIESTQLWLDQDSGSIRFRGGNGTNIVNNIPFKTVATTDDVNAREKVNSQGSNWIRYESGLQLCWNTGVGGNAWWSFPVAFSGTPAVTLTARSGDWQWVGDLSSTGCTNKGSGMACVIAVGRWK